ncbi:MAG: nucleotidyltransferase family protein [Gammaproteobacteria bacterium]
MTAMPSVMLLAAGAGQRLYPLTAHCPKALVSVGGRALILWHLEALAQAGVRRVVINRMQDRLGSLLEQRVRAAQNQCGTLQRLELVFVLQHSRLGTGGDILQALPHLAPAPFVVINADIHTDFPRRSLLAVGSSAHSSRLAHMVLVPPPAGKTGDVGYHSGRVTVRKASETSWTFSGMSVLHPDLFASRVATADKASFFDLWADVLEPAVQQQRVTAELYEGHWTDAGQHASLANLRALLARRMP